uniref:Uncharacterized protein n=1 Tax=Arundo donax TaxID=35708 RepID=A0A0A8Z1E7_ARUDO
MKLFNVKCQKKEVSFLCLCRCQLVCGGVIL